MLDNPDHSPSPAFPDIRPLSHAQDENGLRRITVARATPGNTGKGVLKAGCAGSAMRTLRVMICDDEPLALRRLSLQLAALEGVELAAQCSTGQQVLDRIFATAPDIVIIDKGMPDFDGVDLLDIVSGLPLRPQPLFFIMTAFCEHAQRSACGDQIISLLKPIRAAHLVELIREARELLKHQAAALGAA